MSVAGCCRDGDGLGRGAGLGLQGWGGVGRVGCGGAAGGVGLGGVGRGGLAGVGGIRGAAVIGGTRCGRVCVVAAYGLVGIAGCGAGLRLLLDCFLRLHGFRNGRHRHRRADHGRARDRAEQVVKGSFHSGASR